MDGGGPEAEQLRVRQSLLYAVGCICDDEAQRQQRERHGRAKPAVSKEALALLADLVYKQTEVLATELQFFARHANRKVIKPEDVALCARKLPTLMASLRKYQRENASSSSSTATGAKRRRRNVLDSE